MTMFIKQVLCLMACWVEDPNSEAYKLHLARIPDYFWIAEDGLKFQVICLPILLIKNHIISVRASKSHS